MTVGAWPTPPVPPGVEGRVRAWLHRLCPGFTPAGPALRTETSLLLPGHLDGQAVIAKHPIDPRQFWSDRCRHEITVYRTLSTARSLPVRIPRLVAADTERLLLVLTRLTGEPLDPDRYPIQPLSADRLTALLDILDALHGWPPLHRSLPSDHRYPAQLAALRDEAITPKHRQMFAEVFHAIATQLRLRLQHGDAHPGNTIRAPGGLALIDLEFTALRPPGYDWAMLWVLLGPDPTSRHLIAARIGSNLIDLASFWLAVTLVAAREIISHRRRCPTPRHRARLPRLAADLGAARTALIHLHRRLT